MTHPTLEQIFAAMHARFGPTHWWPGDTPFEIAIGAILTQNTAWRNVELAIANLKRGKLLGPRRMLRCDIDTLEAAIRPTGYFRQKAKRLRGFCIHLETRYHSSMARMAARPLAELREELLELNGIGPETADDILLYACGKPVFVVDTYTRRILSRHGLVPPDIKYEELRAYFEMRLAENVEHFSEFHGLIVYTGKNYCRTEAQCAGCPLEGLLEPGQPVC